MITCHWTFSSLRAIFISLFLSYLSINCFGTNKIPEDKIQDLVRRFFPLKPADILNQLQLKRPIYRKTAAYGHFGREEFPWEATDKAEALKASL